MATGRKNQKLINYHSSNTSANSVFDVTQIDYGEIAVRHHPTQPELYIRTGENTYAVFAATAWTQAAIEDAQGTLNNAINDLDTKYGAFSSNVHTNYAKKSELNAASGNIYTTLHNEINSASGNISEHLVAYYALSADVVTAIEGAAGSAGAVENALKAFSGEVYTNYATKADLKAASGNVYKNATAYTNEVSGNIATHLTSNYASSADTYKAITAATSTTNTLENTFKSFSGYVHNNYATSANTHDAIKAASGKVYTTLHNEINAASGNIATYLTSNYALSSHTHAAIQQISNDVTGVDNKVESLSAGTIALSGNVANYINTKLSNVYTFKGSVATYDALTAITEHNVGDVYNVSGAQGSIGTASYIPPGTNYAWNGTDWDALGGTIDLSTYALQSSVDTVDGRVTELDNKYKAFSANVYTNYPTNADLKAASGRVYTTLHNEINSASGNIATHLTSNYASSADTYKAITAATSTTNTLENTFKSFSGYVHNNYATSANTHDAIKAASGKVYTTLHNEINSASGNIAIHLTSTYASSADTYNAITAATSTTNTLENRLKAFSGEVYTNYATKADLKAASGNVYKNATAYTNEVSGNIATHLTNKYALSANTYNAFTAATAATDNLDNKYGAFSANVANVYVPKINSALQTFQLGTVSTATADSNQSSAFTKTTNNVVTLDLSNLVIDCGDW